MAKKKRAKKAADEGDAVDFEQAMAEVEQIVAKLESGETGLSESLEFYEQGVRRLKQCHSLLHQAEQRIALLSGFDADGNPITEEFEVVDSESSGLVEKGKSRPRSKSPSESPKRARKGNPRNVETPDDDAMGLF